jgi:hypothetical protein
MLDCNSGIDCARDRSHLVRKSEWIAAASEGERGAGATKGTDRTDRR